MNGKHIEALHGLQDRARTAIQASEAKDQMLRLSLNLRNSVAVKQVELERLKCDHLKLERKLNGMEDAMKRKDGRWKEMEQALDRYMVAVRKESNEKDLQIIGLQKHAQFADHQMLKMHGINNQSETENNKSVPRIKRTYTVGFGRQMIQTKTKK